MSEEWCWNRLSVSSGCNISITEMQNHSLMRWPFRKKASSNKEEARRHYNAKDYEKAEPFLDAMLKENPNDAWAMDVLSRLYMNTSRHEETILMLQRTNSSKPKPEFLKRIVRAGCVVRDMETVMRFAPRIKWTSADDDLLSKIHESFWPEEQCRAFFLRSTWKQDMLFPSFVLGCAFLDNDLVPIWHCVYLPRLICR